MIRFLTPILLALLLAPISTVQAALLDPQDAVDFEIDSSDLVGEKFILFGFLVAPESIGVDGLAWDLGESFDVAVGTERGGSNLFSGSLLNEVGDGLIGFTRIYFGLDNPDNPTAFTSTTGAFTIETASIFVRVSNALGAVDIGQVELTSLSAGDVTISSDVPQPVGGVSTVPVPLAFPMLAMALSGLFVVTRFGRKRRMNLSGGMA